MALREDNALQFGDKKGIGLNSTTGAVEPVVDAGTALGTNGAAAAAKRFSNVLTELFSIQSDFGQKMTLNWIEEEITLATDGTTTDSTANLLPANALLALIVGEVTTTITANATGWSLGDGTVAARFLANTTDLTAGTVKVGMAHWHGVVSATNAGPTQAAAAKLRITAAGGNPGAGKVKVTVFYFTAAKAS